MKKAEFDYLITSDNKGSNALSPFVNRPSGFYNRKTSEPFTNLNQIGYVEDPHERKQDLLREEYARLNKKILNKNEPFSHVVRQHGTFYPNFITFGTNKHFPEKKPNDLSPPKYGPFKRGDMMHTGYNKTIGHGNSTEEVYVEERE